MDDPLCTCVSFVMTIAVLFTFLSNNPEISFITKDNFIGESLFSLSFSMEYLHFKRKDLDTDAVYTMLCFLSSYHFITD
jgi:hypothetical protein